MAQEQQRRIRLIQAGVGGHGGGWARNSVANSEDFEVVALVDPNPEALEKSGEVLGVDAERRFADLATAAKRVEADALLSVTPPAVHEAHAEIAAEHGLHLLVEKPLAPGLAAARRMVERHEAAGLQLMVGQNRRWDPEPLAMKAAMDERVLGDFGHGHVDFNLGIDFRGSFRQAMPHVLLVDMAVHHVDLARFILGRDVVRVYAEDFNPAWSAAGGYYESGAALRMIMTFDDGTRLSYSGDWSARGRPESWQGGWTLQCERGRIVFNGRLDGVLVSTGGMGEPVSEVVRPIAGVPASQGQLLAAFAASIRSGTPGMTNGRDNLKTLAAVLAAVESCETSRAVDVPKVD